MSELKKVLRVGIIGLGRAGWNLHVHMLKRHPGFEIVAVCDADKNRLEQANQELGCSTYDKFADILRHPQIDICVIASPTKDHFWMAREALARKIPVVLDKPLAASFDESLQLQSLSTTAGIPIIPFHNFRFNKEFQVIQSILQKDLIGKPFLIKKQVGYFNRRDDWQSNFSEGGGILNAAAIHSVDQVLQMQKGKLIDIWADIRHLVSKGNAPDHTKIIFTFDNGCVCDIEVSWVEALNSYDWLIYGDHGAIRQGGNQMTVRWFHEKDVQLEKKPDRSYAAAESIQWNEEVFSIENGYEDGINPEFYDSLHQSFCSKADLPVSIESAVYTMEILEKVKERAIYQRENRWKKKSASEIGERRAW
jgi:predicted dehydrogenase